jgi:5-methylcytosine-specific restriction protein B
MPETQTIQDALAAYSPDQKAEDKDRTAKGEAERNSLFGRFPLAAWPSMPLSKYALGQADSSDTYCWWMEFGASHLGSIRGGSARKLIIYKHDKKEGWYFDSEYPDEEAAWKVVRAAFVAALGHASRQEWEDIDAISALSPGAALLLKTLHVYFPSDFLPITSRNHLRHFLSILGRAEAQDRSLGPVELNRALLSAARTVPGFEGWTTNQIERFLYRFFDPRDTSRMVKVAPGENAQYWDDCRAGGYICVGWDTGLGDLRAFASRDAFRERFAEVFGPEYNGLQSAITKKANELWTLRELEPGDLIVANRGISEVLGVGRVVEPGYVWDESRNNYKHTVRVEWDTRYAKRIPPQKGWAFVTVAKVPDALRATILDEKAPGPGPAIPPTTELAEPMFEEIADSLERKKQVVLYGPPGTGKTYIARRFSVWWLRRKAGVSDPAAALRSSTDFRNAELSLSGGALSGRVWWVVANPTVWAWQQLFDDGTVAYRYGKLQRNFAVVQVGDLVVGYQATPDKRVVALAKVSRALSPADKDEGPTIGLEPVAKVSNGPTYEELQKHPILATSEPIRFHNQGTLFALTPMEAEALLADLAERDPSLPAFEFEATGVLSRITFHPSYSYEDFIEGYRPQPSTSGALQLILTDGVFKQICRAAEAHPDRSYLLLIDEINRANVAKVFGELITLIESDKRGLQVALAQSKERFTVPENVFILGTMNTADRSIKLLDVAFRRRFAFIELMPDAELLYGAKVGNLPMDDFLTELNRRIAGAQGREKQIGHAYLLADGRAVTEPEEFARIFRQDILPLLQEYCYEDYAELAKLLGPKLVDAAGQIINSDVLNDQDELLEALQQELVPTANG